MAIYFMKHVLGSSVPLTAYGCGWDKGGTHWLRILRSKIRKIAVAEKFSALPREVRQSKFKARVFVKKKFGYCPRDTTLYSGLHSQQLAAWLLRL
jgi:hypothetical protein